MICNRFFTYFSFHLHTFARAASVNTSPAVEEEQARERYLKKFGDRSAHSSVGSASASGIAVESSKSGASLALLGDALSVPVPPGPPPPSPEVPQRQVPSKDLADVRIRFYALV